MYILYMLYVFVQWDAFKQETIKGYSIVSDACKRQTQFIWWTEFPVVMDVDIHIIKYIRFLFQIYSE